MTKQTSKPAGSMQPSGPERNNHVGDAAPADMPRPAQPDMQANGDVETIMFNGKPVGTPYKTANGERVDY